MAMESEEFENVPPQGHVRVVYLGPVAPHWEIHRVFGDPKADIPPLARFMMPRAVNPSTFGDSYHLRT